MTTLLTKKLIVLALIFAIGIVATVYSFTILSFANSCDRTYGGGKECDRGFRIEKKVKVNGADKFEDKVEGVKKGDVLTFRIVVTNIGDVDGKDLEVIDSLPKELEKLTGSLTEVIEVIDNGDDTKVDGCSGVGNAVKVFCITARVKDIEYQTGVQKCVVNEVKLKDEEDGKLKTVASDTATVCYGYGLKELPKTGSEDTVLFTIYGVGLVLTGLFLKRIVS
ncbi:MAG: LPXTG cell wall anchor domain-containing protein [Patescibacteria group bacterium]